MTSPDEEEGAQTPEETTLVTDIDSRIEQNRPPADGEPCPNCPSGELSEDKVVQTPFGDILKYVCTDCELETAGPVPPHYHSDSSES